MKKSIMILLAGLVILAGSFMAPTDAKALAFSIDAIFNGFTPPSLPPYLTASFTQNATNVVYLTLQGGLTSTEYIDAITFNVAPTITPSSITIAEVSKIGSTGTATISNGAQNAQSLTGGGGTATGFDFEFNFSSSNSGGGTLRFNDSDQFVFSLTYTGLTPNDFAYYNSTNSFYQVAAHIAGFGQAESGAATDWATNQNPNTTPPVPEPATMLLFGSGLMGAAAIIRRRFKK